MRLYQKSAYFLLCLLFLIVLAFAGCASSASPEGPQPEGEEAAQQEIEEPDEQLLTGGEEEAGDESGEESGEAKETAPAEEAGEEQTVSNPANGGEAATENYKSGQEKAAARQEETAAVESAEPEDTKEPKSIAVTVAIEGPPEVGTILEATAVKFKEGDTVLDLLILVAQQEGIQVEYRGRGSTAYLEGIANIYEFDYGPESGWLYAVNGNIPQRSFGAWKVEEGDRIEWFYTEKSGRDLDLNSEKGSAGGGND